MLNLTQRSKKLVHIAMTFTLGASLLLAASASANSYRDNDKPNYNNCDYANYKVEYKEGHFSRKPHKRLLVACKDKGYRAIACSASIKGGNYGRYDEHFDKYFVALNKIKMVKQFNHEYGPVQGYSGCKVRANNMLAYFKPSHHLSTYGVEDYFDFDWAIKVKVTCVPKHCVEYRKTHRYFGEHFYFGDVY